ncbi:MAG: fibrillarin-like rRNA/tRNA 2'-O-methyltransferase [Candidatus Woesearchaeota archaeon]|jgi:fibrillarin-like pre-rRNA processing protein|nr:fibrillarin-like rRNA/tRNA 2'-O-methyltransferase [Candidatus Woesearchaeota archaeon]MDP7622960.1 fibrillarin-like rRNA/tRNA 2'-O-methyltransferase [Candidatus Woesearchaeota archaeon]HJN57101.1 fibrillarin-like rRNA/tRNA 2'-O-methyltransferase [Candidatus Woesearchaeota archaeon]|tara:strand:- start:599 stop:1273 length:675 start_codon:yes stop_codon:yes gene_type:complete
MIKKSKVFEVYEGRMNKLYTVNLIPGKSVYDESLLRQNNIEYREWNAYSSKLAAAILNKCPNIFLRKNDVVLYLGSSTGTTVSHVSDIVGKEGFVFAVDVAPRVMRDLVFNLEARKNVAPVLADGNNFKALREKVSMVDFIYQDIAQKNQVNIFMNSINTFMKKDGYAIIMVKARSIDVTRKPKQIFNEIREILQRELTIIDFRELEPYQKDHVMFICKREKTF